MLRLIITRLAILTAVLASPAFAEPENDLAPLHDPCIIRAADTYYVFCTGRGVAIRTSRDLIHWKRDGDVFETMPAWIKQVVPGATGFWAPDIIFVNGEYRLYYTVSTFGSNESAIGLVVTKALNPADPDYGWTDRGLVIASKKTDDWNCIDAGAIVDAEGRAWLSMGSFWSGLKLVELDVATGLVRTGAKVTSIARRPEPPNAIEAPFLTRRGDWYYLWASFDFCCRGARSTYNVRVGRSKSVEGPYVDRAGVPMLDGGGTPVLAGEGDMRGPGHCAVLSDEGRDLLVYHFYDAARKGRPTLQLRRLTWTADGWPVAGDALGPPATQPTTQSAVP